MGAKSKIEWCDASWNPVTGCYHTCEYCYARRMANRFSAGWENASNKTLHTLNNPAIGMRCGKSQSRVEPYPYGFHPTFHRYRLDQLKKWVKPKTIFVCSMADLFGKWVPNSWIQEFFKACEESLQHRYLFLTKNPCDGRKGKYEVWDILGYERELSADVCGKNGELIIKKVL